jgi:hypothetical protein
MTMLTVLPGFIEPTPTDVPQAMTSPASSVYVVRNEARQLRRRKDDIGDRSSASPGR